MLGPTRSARTCVHICHGAVCAHECTCVCAGVCTHIHALTNLGLGPSFPPTPVPCGGPHGCQGLRSQTALQTCPTAHRRPSVRRPPGLSRPQLREVRETFVVHSGPFKPTPKGLLLSRPQEAALREVTGSF